VVVDHMVGGREVEARAGRFQGEDEDAVELGPGAIDKVGDPGMNRFAFESEQQLAAIKGRDLVAEVLSDLPNIPEGKEKERLVRTRVNRGFFRKTILASYNNTCCITGLKMPEMLVAGHIIPWAEDEQNRMNPRNGLCINALHDKAFEVGLLSITPKY